jgi:hypothetical protein
VKFEALHLTLDREYRILHMAISGMLEYEPRIGPALIDRIEELVRERR